MNWLSQWSFDPSVYLGLGLAGLLYWRGWRPFSPVSREGKSPFQGWQALSFYAGLGVIFLALESPIDALAAKLFTFHMIQHLLLIMIAAPLLLLGNPAIVTVRGVPLATRRFVLQALARRSSVRRGLSYLSVITKPRAVFAIFLLDLYLWHWSWLFNLTLENDGVHLLEHVCFLATALLFWSQVIDQRAIHTRLSYAQRTVYTVLTAALSNLLAMYFVFTPKPLYSVYADLTDRPFAMTALADQQIAGAVMWVPVLFLFGGAFAVCLYKFLGEDEPANTSIPVGSTPYSMVFAGTDVTGAGPTPAPKS